MSSSTINRRIQNQTSASTSTHTQTRTQTSTSSAQPSRTQTQTVQSFDEGQGPPVLHLRGVQAEGTGEGRRIQWAEDVVDNEGLGRKRSKVCCIYHAPKGIDESSDESSSGSDSSDSDDDGAARMAGGKGKGKADGEAHGEDCDHDHDYGKGKGKARERKRSPNAYEKMPKPRVGGKGGSGTMLEK